MEDHPEYVVAGRTDPESVAEHLIAVRDHFLTLESRFRKRATVANLASLFVLGGGLVGGAVAHAVADAPTSLGFLAFGLFGLFFTQILFHAPASSDARSARRGAAVCEALRLAVPDLLPPLDASGSNIHSHRRLAWAIYSLLPAVSGDLPYPEHFSRAHARVLAESPSVVDPSNTNTARLAT